MLYLIRHAESISNLLESSTGSIFDELSYQARQECLKLSDNTKDLKKKLNLKIVCTSAARSLETGTLLFGRDISIDCDWLETDGGYLENVPEKYTEKLFRLENNIKRKYPNGESNLFMRDRVINSLKKYLQLISQQNILIVTHLGPIKVVAEFLKFDLSYLKNLDAIVIREINNKYKIELLQNSLFEV